MQWKCQLNINYSGSAGPRKRNADEMLLAMESKCGFTQKTREPLVVFRSSPGVQRGLSGLLICSFYLFLRLTRMTQPGGILGVGFN